MSMAKLTEYLLPFTVPGSGQLLPFLTYTARRRFANAEPTLGAARWATNHGINVLGKKVEEAGWPSMRR
jgi:hypothetical protein